MKRMIAKLMLVFALVFAFCTEVDAAKRTVKEWTFMIFMNGDNNLDQSAVKDLKEIRANGGSNELMNIVTIFLGTTVGATAVGTVFLKLDTLLIIGLGLFAFCVGTACGVLFGKIMCWATGGKVNPLIGSAGVSAVPMAARVSQKVGQAENPTNFLLMHAMGPNVAGVIGTATAAGMFISVLGH